MFFIPRGIPVKENLNPGRVNLADALLKLKHGNFTGYLRFDTPQGVGILIFAAGKILSALFETDHEHLVETQALERIFVCSRKGDAMLHIYRLSEDLATSLQALLHGEVLYKGQELELMDIRVLLAKLKEKQIDGCLRIYAGDRVALIFFHEGSPLGFFHDGSKEIETTADTSMSVARLPGAKVDVLTTASSQELAQVDLLEQVDLAKLWEQALKA